MAYGSSSSFLAEINEATWAGLQDLVRSSRRILWVSPGGVHAPHPDQGILNGLAKTLRLEHYELQLVTLALEAPNHDVVNTKAVRHLTQVMREMVLTGLPENYEQDYTEIDGRLHTHRLVEGADINRTLEQKRSSTQIVSRPAGQVRFETASLGDDSPGGVQYVESSDEQQDIDVDTAEIAVRAVSLQSLGRAAALGWPAQGKQQQQPPVFGEYCAGIVVRAGTSTGLRPGEQVVAATRGPLKSHLTLPSKYVASLALGVSFSAACAAVGPAATAYHALVEVGRVRQGDSVLVHDIASPVGRAAQLLASKEVWTTASDEDDDCWATVEQLGLPSDRVLPKSWFDSPSLLASRWKQAFDIVLLPYANAAAAHTAVHELCASRRSLHPHLHGGS
jgi:hypothetical protein